MNNCFGGRGRKGVVGGGLEGGKRKQKLVKKVDYGLGYIAYKQMC
jgi:hypothetical protein